MPCFQAEEACKRSHIHAFVSAVLDAGSMIHRAAEPRLHPSVTEDWITSWGKVRSEPTTYLPELPGSNNTGELKALIELFDYLLYYSNFHKGDSVIIYTDSQYALSLLLGSSTPVAHHQLVVLAQQYYTALPIYYRVQLLKS